MTEDQNIPVALDGKSHTCSKRKSVWYIMGSHIEFIQNPNFVVFNYPITCIISFWLGKFKKLSYQNFLLFHITLAWIVQGGIFTECKLPTLAPVCCGWYAQAPIRPGGTILVYAPPSDEMMVPFRSLYQTWIGTHLYGKCLDTKR